MLAVPLALGAALPAFLGVAAAGALALLALVLADLAAAHPSSVLKVERQHHPRLYLAADNPIDLTVTNAGRRPVQVALRDTPPVPFLTSALFHRGAVPGGATERFSYTTRPAARGSYRFGGVTLRWLTPLELLWRQRTLPLDEEVAVYPNLLEVQKFELLARRGMLREMGLRTARHHDRGTEFESLREYQPDDDYRRVNWKATARRQKPITTLYETERSQRMLIMLDLGRMMLSSVGELTRLDAAVNASLLLSYVAALRGDRVGFMSFGDTVQALIPPRRGRAQFFRILELLYAVRAQPIESDYATAFARLRAQLRGRSLVVLFTDLSDPDIAAAVGRNLALVARHHLTLCVLLSDPLLTSRAAAVPDSGSALYQKLVGLRMLHERALVLEQLNRAGVITVEAPAGRLAPAVINRYLELKERTLL